MNNLNKYLIDDSCNTYQKIILKEDSIINYDIKEKELNLLIVNLASHDIKLNEIGTVGSKTNIIYISLNAHAYYQKTELNLLKNAELNITSYCLVKDKNNIEIKVTNAYASSCNIDNYLVCLEGKLDMRVIGNIPKGHKYASTHQSTRCLTLKDIKNCRIDPILLIDESEVNAGHALSFGTIDDDLLYYMNSRGLNNNQALAIIIKGYLIPDENTLKNYPNKNDLLNDINKEVDKICSMLKL